jgi:alanyl-tRNA synthetase
MNRKQLIKKYIEFFKSKNHKVIPNASLIPENDPTVLFTTAGMHPLVPYLLGQKHPLGKRLVNVQKCIRTGDIEEVGDSCHHTFFEMLGNWSLGDYFKEEAIKMSYEFLTKNLKISTKDISVTCFAGDKDCPKDDEAAEVWKSLGINKIKFLGKKDNWWGPAGKTGPCGPDTEMFIGNLEIWNDVFMQYNKNSEGKYKEANQKNIDTGMGVERMIAILNNLDDNYLTDVWQPIIKQIEKLSGKKYNENPRITKHMRIIADHIKAATMIIADGIPPGNTEQGYIVRRLIRRAIRYGEVLGFKDSITKIAEPVFKIYPDYSHLIKNKKKILEELKNEEESFAKTLEKGIKEAKKILEKKESLDKEKNNRLRNLDKSVDKIMEEILKKKKEKKDYSIKKANLSKEEIDKALISGEEAFLLYQSYGFPEEMLKELVVKERLLVDLKGFQKELKKHQEKSRTASAGKFKSGLADDSEVTTKLHTATHLLLAALRTVLKDQNIQQRGSNITPERLRFDFNFPRKLTDEEKNKIEELVNAQIQRSCEVVREEMTPKEAKAKGATGVFNAKYGNIVSVYTIKDYSKEICTGPHVKNTCELGKFKIKKEESSSAGIRRIKAVLE